VITAVHFILSFVPRLVIILRCFQAIDLKLKTSHVNSGWLDGISIRYLLSYVSKMLFLMWIKVKSAVSLIVG